MRQKHQRTQRGIAGSERRKKPSMAKELRRFLGVRSDLRLYRLDLTIPGFHLADVARAVRDFLPELGLRAELRGLERSGPRRRSRYEAASIDDALGKDRSLHFRPVKMKTLPVGPDRVEKLPTRFIALISGGPFPLIAQVIPPCCDGDPVWLSFAIVDKPAAIEWTDGFAGAFDRWVIQHSCFRAHMLNPRFGTDWENAELEFLPEPTDGEVSLSPEIIDRLEDGFLTFIRHRTLLEAAAIDARRGLLLCGAAGTGKTSTCRYLKSRLERHTFFVVSVKTFSHLDAMFTLARRFVPSVVVLEDVDLIAQQREANFASGPLVELMNQLDGLRTRDEISVVLTTNSWDFLELALVNRPGRVDEVVLFEAPDDHQRRRLLERFARGLTLDVDPARLLAFTQGLNPAHLKELVKRAAASSLRREGSESWSRTVTQWDLEKARSAIRTNPWAKSRKPIGLLAAERAPAPGSAAGGAEPLSGSNGHGKMD